MQTKINSFITFVSIATIATGVVCGQNDFNLSDHTPANDLSDLAPANVELQRSDQAAATSRPNQLPPIQSSLSRPSTSDQQKSAAQSSIFDNNLRASGNVNSQSQPQYGAGFDSQPTPPPSPNASRRNSTQNGYSQNPLQALDPARLPQSSNPTTNTPASGPFNKPDNNETRKFSASSIPASSPSTRRSIMNPVNNSDPNIIVAAGFENEDQSRNTQTRVNRSSSNSRTTAKSIIAQYSITNSNQALPGVPTSLEDMLRTTDTGSRLKMVQKYWETYFDWATLQNRQRFENWLNKLPAARASTDRLLLQTAKSMAENETLAAEIQLARSQSLLQEISRSNPNEMLPLPLNDPVTSKYITHYDWYATRQLVPPKLKGINEMLPRTYQLLTQRASTVGQAEQARNQALAAYTSGQTSIAAVLESGRAWQAGLQSLVATVVSYNKAISDYALTIAPQQKPVSEIASMLVSKPKPVSAANMAAPVSRTNNVAKNQPYNQTYNQPRQSPARSTGPQAIGPNAGVFRKSQVPQQPRNFANPTSTQRQQGAPPMNQPNPADRGFGNARSAAGSAMPGTNPLAPRNQPSANSQYNSGADASNSFKSGIPGNRTQPTNSTGNNNQMFGSGGGGAFGGG